MRRCVSAFLWALWPRCIGSASVAVEQRPAISGKEIRVAHYNILASYLGHNREPWFLLPLNLSSQERHTILEAFHEKDAKRRYVHSFEDGFGGLISEAQILEVQEHERNFDWMARFPKVLRVVEALQADIISLVEMDRFEDFQDALGRQSFDGAFAKRPRAQSLDGSSIFWRRERFELVGEPMKVTFEDWEPRQNEVYREDRAMIAVALRDRADGRVLVAASVHLLRNPEDTGKDPMRMLEVSQMMRALTCVIEEHQAAGLVVMGDFNAVPQSWTHVFMLHGWQDCPKADKGMRDAFHDIEWGGAQACTTRTLARALWIDYIFYSSRTMDLAGAPVAESCPQDPMPNEEHPSDHLPLAASVRFRADAEALSPHARLQRDGEDVSASCVAF